MTYTEKKAWLMLVAMVLAYSLYFGLILAGHPAGSDRFAMLWLFGTIAATQAIVVIVGYLLLVHWWFTAPFLAMGGEIDQLREQEGRFRAIIASRPAIEARLQQASGDHEFPATEPTVANFSQLRSLIGRTAMLWGGLWVLLALVD